jgi:HPt (histidine-containing phosphotransfer) domain-containing protein
MDEFVSKPLSPEKIRTTIQSLRGPSSKPAELPDTIGRARPPAVAEAMTGMPGAPGSKSDGQAVRPYDQPRSRDSTVAGVSLPLQVNANAQAPCQTLDLSIFHYLSDQQPDKLRQIAEKFITALDQDVVLLAEAVRSGSVENTRRQAHRVLSQTALISAARVASAAAVIQEAARKGDVETPRSAFAAFETEVTSLKSGLRSALETS